MRLLPLFLMYSCFGTLELEGGSVPYGGPFDEQQARALWVEMTEREAWPAFPGYDGLFENADPHGLYGRVLINGVASEAPDELPLGSLIVKYDYEADETISSITAIKRVDNFNPEAFDWFWARFDVDGRPALDELGSALAGAIEPGCIDCHRDAPGDDYVFLNGEQ